MNGEGNGVVTESKSSEAKSPETKRVACMGCRTIKVRCIQGPPGHGDTCSRCVRLKMVCVYIPRGSKLRRAPKPDMTVIANTRSSTNATTSSHSNYGNGPLSPRTYTLSRMTNHQRPSAFQILSPHETTPTPAIQFKHSPNQLSSATTTNSSSSSIIPEHQGVGTDPNHSVRSLLEAAEAAEARSSRRPHLFRESYGFPPPVTKRKIEYPDPFTLGLLTREEGEYLLQRFHEILNSYIIIFDPKLHTLEFLLSTSTVLLTAVMAVSSKFYRPDLYPILLAQAQLLVTRAWADALSELGVVQALMCLVYWKEPTDSSSWLRIGYALRLGYQLRLHHPRMGPLPEDDHEARMVLDRERTFISMNCFDSSYRLYCDKDPSNMTSMTKINELDAAKWWAENHELLTQDDRQFGYSVSNCKVHGLIRALDALGASGSSSIAAIHLHAKDQLKIIYEAYIRPDRITVLSRLARQKIRFNFSYTPVLLDMTIMSYKLDDLNLLSDFVAHTSEMVSMVEELATDGFFRMMQDVFAVILFRLAEFLAKLFPVVTPGTQARIADWMNRILISCSHAAASEPPTSGGVGGVAATVARLYRFHIRLIMSQSTPGTRASSPVSILVGKAGGSGVESGANDAGAGEVQTTRAPDEGGEEEIAKGTGYEEPLPFSMDDLFPDFATSWDYQQEGQDVGELDASYWESLFPGLGTSGMGAESTLAWV
ncbi:hypothetical protein T439DRAFT_330174 [Meredithblackwellia eburnea MCA 4105]